MRRFITTLFMIWVAANLAACAGLEKVVQKPGVSVSSVNFRTSNLSEGLLESQLVIHNPNSFSLPVQGVVYRLSLNDREFANNSLSLDKSIPANGQIQVSVPITLRYAEIFEGISRAFNTRTVQFRLHGDIDFGLLRVPYSKTGSFDLRF